LEISERIPLEVTPNGYNWRYLQTKEEKLNHVLKKQ
jgi:3,4-dihydroxy 2-butanone 4-phosphate synthase / GTP cyclohydrolase II